MSRPSRARRSESGAAALEFALISPFFFLLLFGILQYGLYFSDSNSLRQGVREAARAASVENFAYPGCSGTASAKLICATKGQIGNLTGTPAVKVSAPGGWAKGQAVRVCAAVTSQGAVGMVPMPNGGTLRAVTQMTIERDDTGAAWADSSSAVDPTGGAWSWC